MNHKPQTSRYGAGAWWTALEKPVRQFRWTSSYHPVLRTVFQNIRTMPMIFIELVDLEVAIALAKTKSLLLVFLVLTDKTRRTTPYVVNSWVVHYPPTPENAATAGQAQLVHLAESPPHSSLPSRLLTGNPHRHANANTAER